MRLRALRRVAWAILAVGAAALYVKSFVGDVYRIGSPSMEPTLETGEWVWVRFDRGRPERGEIVALEKRGELLVKRVVGLGGESLRIHPGGDVLINEAPLPPGAGRGAPIVIYDQARTSVEACFAHGSSTQDPWLRRDDGSWELDGRDVQRDSQAGLLRYVPALVDGWPGLEERHEQAAGRDDVGDALLEYELYPLEATGRARAVLVEKGDRFTLSIELGGPEAGRIELLRRDSSGLTSLATGHGPISTGIWIPVRFANVDDHLVAAVGDPPVRLEAYTGPNTLHPSDHAQQGLSFGHRVMLGGEECHVLVRGIRILRDLHYTSRGEHGVERDVQVGEDQIFVLGDNSPASRDSRDWGPVDLRDVWGRAVWVVWPPAAVRSLAGARWPPRR